MNTNPDPSAKRPSEDVLRAYAPRPAVRRLNRAAIAVIFLIVALLFAGRTIVGLYHRYAAQITEEERERNRLRAPDDLAERAVVEGLPADYKFMRPRPQQTRPEPPRIAPEPLPLDPDILRQLEILRREQESAINSPIRFSHVQPTKPDNDQRPCGTQNEFPHDAYYPGASAAQREPHFDARRREFFRDATQVQSYVRAPILPPRSPYEIKAGSIIPAALITPINSDLPGDVVGHVTENLYDTASGRFLLVPQGARLIGRYDTEVHKGHNRVLIAWQRLVLPNGYSIVLEAMPGTDAQGVAGMADQVDWHAKRLAGATLLSTLIALGGNYAANIDPARKERTIVGETVAQDASRIGQRVIDRELDLRPTILVRQGTPFNVLVTKDLELLPYQPVITRR